MSRQRIAYIDLIKGIGILCVLQGHLIANDNIIKPSIYSFHMPLFFIVTGMLLKKESIKIKVNKKMNQIIIPYIIWGLIFTKFSFSKLALILYGTNESLIIAESNGMLWFLIASFSASIIATLFVNSKYIEWSAIRQLGVMIGLFGMSLLFFRLHSIVNIHGHIMGLPLSLDVSILGTVFTLYGFFLQKFMLPQIKKLELLKRFLISVVIFVVTIAIAKENRGNLGYQQMATYNVGNPVIFTVMAVVICTALIVICEVVMELSLSNTNIIRAIMWMGRNSMVIFIIHRTLVYDLKAFCEIRANTVIYIVAWLILCIYSCLLTYVVTKITPFLAGKSNKR